jgi:hypothetical protein
MMIGFRHHRHDGRSSIQPDRRDGDRWSRHRPTCGFSGRSRGSMSPSFTSKTSTPHRSIFTEFSWEFDRLQSLARHAIPATSYRSPLLIIEKKAIDMGSTILLRDMHIQDRSVRSRIPRYGIILSIAADSNT